MTDENVYSAPQSDVTPIIQQSNEIILFPRMSLWTIFFLTIITYGFYPYYWIYNRTKIVNSIPNRKLPMLQPTMILILASVAIVLSIIGAIRDHDPLITGLTAINTLVNLAFYVIAAFSLRRELGEILESSGAREPKLSGGMVFFFCSFYMQYKINKCLEQKGIR